MTHDFFRDFHPLVNFLYFVPVLGLAMFLHHPAAQAVSIVCAVIYAIQTEGRKAVLFTMKFTLPLLLITAFINPAFNHEGATILTYFPNGNPLTLESLLYGLSAGCMMASVMLWFVNFNRIMTADKFIYLFGRVIPSLSLVLSMTLRFIPNFRHRMTLVKETQESFGRDTSKGSLLQRLRNATSVLSIMVTWSLENAIETADSMKSRGYGLKGRTAFSIYRFDDRDRLALVWIILASVYLLCGSMISGFDFRFFPTVHAAPINAWTVSFFCMYLALCVTPILINAFEERKWKALYSDM